MIDNNVTQYLEMLLNAALVILPTLAVLAMTFPAARYVAQFFISGWRWLRPQIDEPTDALAIKLAQASGRTPEEVVEITTGYMDKFVNIIKEAQLQAKK